MNYKLIIAYDGTRYKGWERQPATDMTVQGKIEQVLKRMVTDAAASGTQDAADEEIHVIAAGRTDAGVHALAMCANVHLDCALSEQDIASYLNRYLPEDIAVTKLHACSDRFHARYNATGKTYRYTCYTGAAKPVFDRKYVAVLERMPDVDKMRDAARVLCGTHDFKSFCLNKGNKSTVRTVDLIDITVRGDYLRFTYHGNGFLRGMVRIMTGTLLETGFGERKPSDMEDILRAKSRAASGHAAPPQGLSLISVDYD